MSFLGDIASGVGSVIGDITSGLGLTSGAQQQQAAQQYAAEQNRLLAQQAQQFYQDQAQKGLGYLQDYGQQGVGALQSGQQGALGVLQGAQGQLGNMYSGFQQDPGYQFRLQQGEQALNRSAAAQGGRLGGAQLKALANFNQGLASQEFGNFANRQQVQSGMQNNLAQAQAGIYGGTGQSLANLYSGLGANAAGLMGGVGQVGMQSAQSQMNANNQYAGAAGMGQQAQTNAMMNLAGLGMAAFSDERLKTDIRTIKGSRYERIGLRGVSFAWNDKAKTRFGLEGRSNGVIAQEVAEKYPEVITVAHGYMMVNYEMLENIVRKAA